MNEFTEFLSSIWSLFTDVNVPGINISFAELWIGVFVISISIMILRPLLGIGARGFNNLTNNLRKTTHSHTFNLVGKNKKQ